MAYSQTQITALENALAMGVLEVEYDGKRTRFQSAADMRRQLAVMKDAVAGGPPLRYQDTIFDRG